MPLHGLLNYRLFSQKYIKKFPLQLVGEIKKKAKTFSTRDIPTVYPIELKSIHSKKLVKMLG